MKHYEVTITLTATHIFSIEAETSEVAKSTAVLTARTYPQFIRYYIDTADIEVEAVECTKETTATVIPFPRG